MAGPLAVWEKDMIDIDIAADGIATLTWNMADRSMNVLYDASMAAFGAAVAQVVADYAVTGVIVTSAKRDFIAGADLFAFACGH